MQPRRLLVIAIAFCACSTSGDSRLDHPRTRLEPPETSIPALRLAVYRSDANAIAALNVPTAAELASALHLAVRLNHLACAKALLARGADANARDADGNSPLHLVQSDTMVRLLVASGAEVRAANSVGKSIVDRWLGVAMQHRIVEALMAAGAEPDVATCVRLLDLAQVRRALATQPISDPCLLHFAAERSDPAIVQLLLDAGADPEQCCASGYYNESEWGSGALATAVQRGNFAAAETLLRAGARLRGDGWPDRRHRWIRGGLLERAASDAPLTFVMQLLDAGAKPDESTASPTEAADTALGRAAGRGRTDVVRLLLARGADPSRLSGKATPLLHACVGGHAETADVLVAAGAHMTLLDAVALGRLADVRRLLIEEPTRREEPDARLAMRPLLWAVSLRHADVVEHLLAAGACIDARSNTEVDWVTNEVWWGKRWMHRSSETGVSAFGRAIEIGEWSIAAALLTHGAVPDEDEARALAGAAEPKATTVLQQLLDRGMPPAPVALAALAGVLSASLPPGVREERFRVLLGSGIANHLASPIARDVARDAEPLVAAPFVGRLRRLGWTGDLETACRFGWADEVDALFPAARSDPLAVSRCVAAAIRGDHPDVLCTLRVHIGEAIGTPAEIASAAAYAGSVHVLMDLLARGKLDGNDLRAHAAKLLGNAASYGRTQLLEWLLDLGLDVNASREGFTPLILACMNRHRAAIELLLRRGARCDVASDNGKSPLGELVRDRPTADSLACIRLLLDAGADPLEGNFLGYLERNASAAPNPELCRALNDVVATCLRRRSH